MIVVHNTLTFVRNDSSEFGIDDRKQPMPNSELD